MHPIFLSRRNLGRMRQVLLVAGRYGFGELIGWLPLPFRRPSCKECQESKDLPVWAKLRKLMEDLGPTTIKIGQVLSLRPDMVPVALSGLGFPVPGASGREAAVRRRAGGQGSPPGH